MTGCWYSKTYVYLVLTAELLRVQYVMTRSQHSRSHHIILPLFPTLTLFFFWPLPLLCSWNLVTFMLHSWLSIQYSFILSVLTNWESLSPLANEKSSFSDQNWQYLPLIYGHKLWCLKGSLAFIWHFSKATVASTTRVYGLHSHELLTEYQMWMASCELTIK